VALSDSAIRYLIQGPKVDRTLPTESLSFPNTRILVHWIYNKLKKYTKGVSPRLFFVAVEE